MLVFHNPKMLDLMLENGVNIWAKNENALKVPFWMKRNWLKYSNVWHVMQRVIKEERRKIFMKELEYLYD